MRESFRPAQADLIAQQCIAIDRLDSAARDQIARRSVKTLTDAKLPKTAARLTDVQRADTVHPAAKALDSIFFQYSDVQYIWLFLFPM